MVDLIRERGVADQLVLDAMAKVPRHRFIPEPQLISAYGDYALPIGHRQTISQPYIVALMTEALRVSPGDRVLEIGTGSGYQSAVLAEMGMVVTSVERIAALHTSARNLLMELGYTVSCRLGDGYEGWPEHAPYRGIIVTAAATRVPEPLVDQLAEGGHLVIPVGAPHSYQTLWDITKERGAPRRTDLGGVAFVPFVSPDL